MSVSSRKHSPSEFYNPLGKPTRSQSLSIADFLECLYILCESMVVEKLEIYVKVKLDQENNLKPMYLLIFHIVI